MIIGIGTDMANIARIADTLAQHGDRFVDRCFSDGERARVETTAKGDARLRAAGYAKRWAAKEACAKALGLGIRDGIYLKDIAVANDDQGRPSLVLSGGAAGRLAAIVPAHLSPALHLSLSDDGGMALAFVIIAAEASHERG